MKTTSRRDSFNEIAELYNEARPTYPAEITDAIVEMAALPLDARILEVGCGTGQITRPFAARGYRILALELGAALADIAARQLQPYPQVEVMATAFEDWPVEQHAFDLVLSAQAFHWIEPVFGYNKAAAALKRGGSIALVWNLDVSASTAFHQATQRLYDTYFPPAATAEDSRSLADKVYEYKVVLGRSEAFGNLREVRRPWEATYSGPDYLKLLRTYSNHQTLPEPNKTAFFQAMAETIDQFGGVVTRKYETVLLLAVRR